MAVRMIHSFCWRHLLALFLPLGLHAQPLLLDPAFTIGGGFTGGPIAQQVNTMAVQTDGRVVVGGWFLQYDGVTVNRIARLMPNGERDTSFHTGTGFDGPVDMVALQPDGRILVSGPFSEYNGALRNFFVRLFPNGDLDTTFTPFEPFPIFYGGVVYDVEVLADGSFFGGGANGVWKYQSNGAFDLAIPFESTFGSVEEIALRPDGKLLVVGDIARDVNDAVIGVGQYLPTGSWDPGFTPPANAPGVMYAAAIRPDGIALVAGSDTLLALGTDGSPHPGFNLGTYQFSGIRKLLIEPNGDVLVGMSNVTGPTAHQGICRVDDSGAIDPACDVDASGVVDMAFDPAGRLYIGGGFTSVLGTPRPYMARVQRTGLTLQLRAFLGGAYLGGGLMSDALSAQGLVPLTEPFTGLGFVQAGGGGSETTTNAVLQAGGDNNVTDWVLIEARSGTASSNILATRSALIQVDGDIVATDGSPLITLPLLPGGYHIAVRHRNHLGVMTAATTPTVAPGTAIPIDLGAPTTATFGSNAQRNIAGTMVLWPGDTNSDGNVAYTGSGNDRDLILVTVGGTTPNNVVNAVYSTRDTNLNGSVAYVGLNNDRDPILLTVGNTTPNNVRPAQLP